MAKPAKKRKKSLDAPAEIIETKPAAAVVPVNVNMAGGVPQAEEMPVPEAAQPDATVVAAPVQSEVPAEPAVAPEPAEAAAPAEQQVAEPVAAVEPEVAAESAAVVESEPVIVPEPTQNPLESEPVDPDLAAATVETMEPWPVSKPRKPKRRRSVAKRIVVTMLLILLVVGLGYGAYIVNIVAKISTNPWQLSGMTADAGGRTNILVLGVGDPGHAGENLTDTLMLLSLEGPTHRIAEISIPRDLRVEVPGYGFSKINAANVRGGVPLARQTVSNTLDVPVDHFLKTNFSGLKNLVDAVGGIDVNVKTALIDSEYPCDDDQYKVCGLNIPAGPQHMDGAKALQYVRCRKGTCGNDFGRSARQQEVLGLLRPKLTDWHLLLQPSRLTMIAQAVQGGVQTDMGLPALVMLASSWQSAQGEPIKLVLSTAPGGYLRSDPAGSSDLLPIGGSFIDIQKAVKEVFVAH